MSRSGESSKRPSRKTRSIVDTAQFWAVLFALGLIGASGIARADGFEFVAFGDLPYDEGGQMHRLLRIGEAVRGGDYPFVINYGDVKGGGEKCTNALLLDRLAKIHAVLPGRVFLTPGDNDWTDCDRDSNGGYDELERLSFIRHAFTADPIADDRFETARQRPDFPENALWHHAGVVFATLHVVGTDNGRRKIGDNTDKGAAYAAVEARDAANLAWLTDAFRIAESRDAQAVVVAFHADPTDFKHQDRADMECSAERRKKCNPYKTVVDALRDRAASFGKPVLAVHGSTSPICFARDFGGSEAPNLWRLNGPGDFAAVDAAVVTVEPSAAEPFKARLLIEKRPVPYFCL